MDEQQHHEELIKGISEQFKDVLEKSTQAIYIYLDDTHKICNEKFAQLLGYDSAKAWAEIEAPLADVIEEDQDKVVEAYTNVMEKNMASNMDVRFKNAMTDEVIKAQLIMVPVMYSGHLFAIHFLSKI
jgi:PAS domain-containing protein